MTGTAEPATAIDQLARLRSRIVGERRRATTAALAPYVRDVDAVLAGGTRPGKRYWGDCYRKAADYVLTHSAESGAWPGGEGMSLVHGVCCRDRLLWAHAWVALPQALVFDGVRQQFYDQEGYRRVLQAVAEATYSREDMVEQMQATQRYGPWHQGILGHASAGRLDEARYPGVRSRDSLTTNRVAPAGAPGAVGAPSTTRGSATSWGPGFPWPAGHEDSS